jgi:hypothetical protein
MADPQPDPREETEEIDREMRILEQHHAGAEERSAVRRIGLVVVTAILVALALWYFAS